MQQRIQRMRQQVQPWMRQVRRWLEDPRRHLGIIGVAVATVVIITGGTVMLVNAGSGSSSHLPLTVPTLAPSKDGTIFSIVQTSSEASFTIDEVLLGRPNTVVGRTDQVAGQILVDTQDPTQSKVGEIRVDLSALTTNNGLRNRTLWDNILQTTQPADQFATFRPTQISGLPSSVTIGQPFSFQIAGTLTIHAVTRKETFQVRVTLASPTLLEGTAQTTVSYVDFDISVPRPPMVASVSDNVVLALSFTAKA